MCITVINMSVPANTPEKQLHHSFLEAILLEAPLKIRNKILASATTYSEIILLIFSTVTSLSR